MVGLLLGPGLRQAAAAPARRPITAMTTSSSIKVQAGSVRLNLNLIDLFRTEQGGEAGGQAPWPGGPAGGWNGQPNRCFSSEPGANHDWEEYWSELTNN